MRAARGSPRRKTYRILTETISNTVRPITDLSAWADALPEDARRSIAALSELLSGTTSQRPQTENATDFTLRGLDVDTYAGMINERRELTPVQTVTVGVAFAELITRHEAEVGPGDHIEPPAYTSTEVGDSTYRYPQCLRAIFPAGTMLPDAACVIGIDNRGGFRDPALVVFARADHHTEVIEVLDTLMQRADELNLYRGRAVRASMNSGGLAFEVINLTDTLSRETVVVNEAVWREIDLGVTAVRDQHGLLNSHGLGSRRGVLLAGPPGTGKSAVSAVVARELLQSGFTVVYVEARAGESLLTAVVEEVQRIGGGVLIVLEDVDLFVGDRLRGGRAGLAELLQAMDIAPDARILTLASTNDVATLDAAAVRTGRFDSIVEVGYPDASAAGRILATLVDGIPGEVDTRVVADRLPPRTSGSDLREIVRRAVLSGAGTVSTAALLGEIGSGRYRAAPVGMGQYL